MNHQVPAVARGFFSKLLTVLWAFGLGEEVIWHVIIDGEQHGPLSRDQILEYLHDGQLVGSDLIWRPGFRDWKRERDC